MFELWVPFLFAFLVGAGYPTIFLAMSSNSPKKSTFQNLYFVSETVIFGQLFRVWRHFKKGLTSRFSKTGLFKGPSFSFPGADLRIGLGTCGRSVLTAWRRGWSS